MSDQQATNDLEGMMDVRAKQEHSAFPITKQGLEAFEVSNGTSRRCLERFHVAMENWRIRLMMKNA